MSSETERNRLLEKPEKTQEVKRLRAANFLRRCSLLMLPSCLFGLAGGAYYLWSLIAGTFPLKEGDLRSSQIFIGVLCVAGFVLGLIIAALALKNKALLFCRAMAFLVAFAGMDMASEYENVSTAMLVLYILACCLVPVVFYFAVERKYKADGGFIDPRL